MTEAISNAPVVSRRNPAALSPARANHAAYGPFCDAVRRLGCLTPTQKLLAWVLAQATFRKGFTSLAFSSLTELTQVRPQARPFAGLGKNDLSPALNALKHFGLVSLEERAPLESGVPPVTVLLMIADASQWAVPADGWLFSVEEERELLSHLLACRQRWTAYLPELAVEPDLHDARAAVAAEEVSRNALVDTDERARAACRSGAFARSTVDAHRVCHTRQERAVMRERSESRNAERPANAGGVLKVGTLLSLKTKEDKRLKTNLKHWSEFTLEQKKDALSDLETATDGDELRRIFEIILGEDVASGERFTPQGHRVFGDAGKWINAIRTQRRDVHRCMASVIERCFDPAAEKITALGGWAHREAVRIGIKFKK